MRNFRLDDFISHIFIFYDNYFKKSLGHEKKEKIYTYKTQTNFLNLCLRQSWTKKIVKEHLLKFYEKYEKFKLILAKIPIFSPLASHKNGQNIITWFLRFLSTTP